jgi:SAM-dependent methyltransferase
LRDERRRGDETAPERRAVPDLVSTSLLSGLWGRAFSPDGLALPPKRLRALVAVNLDTPTFLANGRREVAMIERTLAGSGLRLDSFRRILDFGCGCGRVLRHLGKLDEVELHGCDYNPELVSWCAGHLPFAAFARNELEPPLPYESETFDFAWAFSIFTHLPRELQRPWIEELRRVLARGGHLLFSVHGDSYAAGLEGEELRAYQAGELVVHAPDLAGSNTCGAFHPEAYVRGTLAEGFDVLSHTPGGELYHDVYLFRVVDAGRGPA